MMTTINKIWEELEEDSSQNSNLLLRRLPSDTKADFYIALRNPEKVRGIALWVNPQSWINLFKYSDLKDIKIEIVPDEKSSSKYYVLVVLVNQLYKDIFSVLCEDLIKSVDKKATIEDVLKEVLNRLEKWASLFDKAFLDGLSPDEQKGLYGELYFLRKWILKSTFLPHCVHSWIGPDKDLRDFQSIGWGIEVKTTSGNNHQKINISSERQLDSSNLTTLFLYHVSIEVQQNHGESLNQIVTNIVDLLSNDLFSLTKFKSKLLDGGYFDHHAYKYVSTGYHIRSDTFYDVRDNFPRIVEAVIPNGVGDVKYTVILSEQSEYVVTESFVFETIS